MGSYGRNRAEIKPGARVRCVQKQDQRSAKMTKGIVADILTKSSNHPRGTKVRLTNGIIGRVKEMLPEIRVSTHGDLVPAAGFSFGLGIRQKITGGDF